MSDQMLVALAPLLTDPDLEQEGLRFADDLSNKLGAADTYAALVPNLPSDRLPALVEALPSVSSYADDVLRALAPRLVPEQLARSLDLVLAAEFELDRADGLEALAPYLGPDLLRHALEGTAAMTEDLARAGASP